MSEPQGYVGRKELVGLLKPYGFSEWETRKLIDEGVIPKENFGRQGSFPRFHWPTIKETLKLTTPKT